MVGLCEFPMQGILDLDQAWTHNKVVFCQLCTAGRRPRGWTFKFPKSSFLIDTAAHKSVIFNIFCRYERKLAIIRP